MGIEEGAVRVEVDSRGMCSVVSRVVVDICSIKNSGALGSQRVAGARISPWSEKVIRGEDDRYS